MSHLTRFCIYFNHWENYFDRNFRRSLFAYVCLIWSQHLFSRIPFIEYSEDDWIWSERRREVIRKAWCWFWVFLCVWMNSTWEHSIQSVLSQQKIVHLMWKVFHSFEGDFWAVIWISSLFHMDICCSWWRNEIFINARVVLTCKHNSFIFLLFFRKSETFFWSR